MTASVVVMGVAGSGKSTVGAALAERMGCPFIEGDDHHPPANVAKMTAGIALDDTDREPWLDSLNQVLRAQEEAVLACSALTHDYRHRLGRHVSNLMFVHLIIDETSARRRLRHRRTHYMPESMVAGQLAALEDPAEGEAIHLDALAPVDRLVEQVFSHLDP